MHELLTRDENWISADPTKNALIDIPKPHVGGILIGSLAVNVLYWS